MILDKRKRYISSSVRLLPFMPLWSIICILTMSPIKDFIALSPFRRKITISLNTEMTNCRENTKLISVSILHIITSYCVVVVHIQEWEKFGLFGEIYCTNKVVFILTHEKWMICTLTWFKIIPTLSLSAHYISDWVLWFLNLF